MDEQGKRIIAEKDGAIGWVIFHNPERRNAISTAMYQSIPGVIAEFERDEAIRVIVLRGHGDKAFAAGADISQFEQVRASEADVARFDQMTEAASDAVYGAEKPTIAMVHGFCIGGGLGFAVSCDLRIAAETARFAIPAAKLGVGYRFHGVRKLMSVVGPAFTKEIFYTGRQFDAREALEMGLVNRVLPAEQLEGHVRETADTIAGKAPLTIRAIKTIVGEILKDPAERDLERCDQVVVDCFSSEDYVEGRRAFMEKRPPRFKGR